MKRPQIVAANKMDLPEANDHLNHFLSKIPDDIKVVPISAFTLSNLDGLLYAIADALSTIPLNQFEEIRSEEVVEYTYHAPVAPFSIEKDGDGVYNVIGVKVKELFDRTDFNNESSVKRFSVRLRNLGIDQALRDLGVKDGDLVRVLSYEFEYKD